MSMMYCTKLEIFMNCLHKTEHKFNLNYFLNPPFTFIFLFFTKIIAFKFVNPLNIYGYTFLVQI
jgi:hypothetical protein